MKTISTISILIVLLFGSGAAAQSTTWDFDGEVTFCNAFACGLGDIALGDPFRGYIKANTAPNVVIGPSDITSFLLLLGDLEADSADATVLSAAIETDGNGDFVGGQLELSGTIDGIADLVLFFDITLGTWEITTDFLGIGIAAAGVGDWGFEPDGDGLGSIEDNCTLAFNADQRDTDFDGIGNACDGDFDQDCSVNFLDLQTMSENFFAAGDLDTDLNGDLMTNFLDLQILKPLFFGPPGPSGVPNICSQ